ncbi:MAG TPA: phosphatidylglycerophosphatase A [Verrucomicrobiae bacterium]
MNDRSARQKLLLWTAQGFGVGWLPFAPGTFGSILGFGWLALLLVMGNVWLFFLGSIAAIPLAVWLCGVAEKELGRKDPGSVVLDEVVAIPVCLWCWMALYLSKHGSLPAIGQFFAWANWPLLLVAFAAFRFFDILKPWPVRQSQSLPGGWGIVIDDFLAALYVNALLFAAWATRLL